MTVFYTINGTYQYKTKTLLLPGESVKKQIFIFVMVLVAIFGIALKKKNKRTKRTSQKVKATKKITIHKDTLKHFFTTKHPFVSHTPKLKKTSPKLVGPYANSAIAPPPKSIYSGPLFQLRHDYPHTAKRTVGVHPWRTAIKNGKITQSNAKAYVEALKRYISKDMRKILFNYKNWKPKSEPWWESIWLGQVREPIHGLYVGSGFPAGTLDGQNIDITTYVFTMYDKIAAPALGHIWNKSPYYPNITNPGAQTPEGGIVIKFAFQTACGSDWPAMKGAAMWQAYAPLNPSNGSGQKNTSCPNNGSKGKNGPALTNLYLMQFDIIVKDSVSAPKTGWVFSTLVYDKDAPGKDAWDKMVVLGATWGNRSLQDNWVNQKTPKYARSTLGWQGRLSGPNDGAVAAPAWYKKNGKFIYNKKVATVGCLGCHSAAQYQMKSFLLPTTTYPPTTIKGGLVIWEPGSKEWMKWFTDRLGTVPMDPGKGQVGLDFDMVTSFKAIPAWQRYCKQYQLPCYRK